VDKRTVTFIASAMLVMVAYLAIRAKFFPPPQPAPNDDQAKVEAGEDPAGAKKEDEKKKTDSETKKGDPTTEPGDPDTVTEPDTEPEEEPAETLPTRVISIGSLDRDEGVNYLATFTTTGGAIKRLELSNQRYLDLDIAHGYLGNLELEEVTGGLKIGVNIEGAGTPADLAGLRRDWVITGVGGTPTTTLIEYDAALAETKPEDTIKLDVKTADGSKKVVEATLTRAPLQLLKPESSVFEDEVRRHPYSFRLTLAKPPEQHQDVTEVIDSLLEGNWELVTPKEPTTADRVVEFARTLTTAEKEIVGLTGKWTITKKYELVPFTEADYGTAEERGYHLAMSFDIKNESGSAQDVCYWLDGPTGAPTEGWWSSYKIHPKLFQSAGARDVVIKTDSNNFKIWGAGSVFRDTYKKPEKNVIFTAQNDAEERTIEFIGIDTQYFVIGLAPGQPGEIEPLGLRRAEAVTWHEATKDGSKRAKASDTSFRLQSGVASVKAGESLAQSFTIFAGPKEPELVEAYGMGDTIYYGWFAIVSAPLLKLLHIFSYITMGNYGLAIIMLTLLVRGCMWPLSRKAARNAQLMQVLKPEMDAIREKHKNDMEKQGKAQRELMAKYNVNPFGGCMLMFVQMPIFLGLYRGLSVDVELRDQSLIPGLSWASNLAAPDRLFHWGDSPAFLFAETGWLGPYLNILPLITVGLFILQQKLFMPPATDDQTRMQQKMMNYMMVFMGLMFFKVPSGLCLYFITTSIFSIAERKLLPAAKPTLDDLSKKAEKKSKLGEVAGNLPWGKKEEPIDPKKKNEMKKKRAKEKKQSDKGRKSQGTSGSNSNGSNS